MKKTGYSPEIFMTKGSAQMGENDHVISRSARPFSDGLKIKTRAVWWRGLILL